MIERTLTIQQYVRLYFEPVKADGETIGQIDPSDHPTVWSVDGVELPVGMSEIGIARIHHGGGSTCDVHALNAQGGTQIFTVAARGDADMDGGEVRDVIWTAQLQITVLPDEAVAGAGRVSEPLDI